MKDDKNHLTNAINRIFNTHGHEISCDAAAVFMAQAADARLTPEASQQQYPDLWQHFQLCPDCAAEYDILMRLSGLTEDDGGTTAVSPIPARPQTKKEPFWQHLQTSFQLIFPGFTPQLGAALTRGNDLAYKPVEITVDDHLILALDVGINENDSALRDLYCHLSTDIAETEMKIEGSTALIGYDSESRTILQEETINALGDVSFSQLSAGETYMLWFQLADSVFQVNDIRLP